MGCDFYIYTYLEIHHMNGISYYPFPMIRGYYCELEYGGYDSDDEYDYYNSIEHKTLYENMKKIYLTPRKPLVIYNHSFITPKLEMKYLPIIQNKMNNNYIEKYPRYKDTGIFTSIEQIIKIVKKEERYDRLEEKLYV